MFFKTKKVHLLVSELYIYQNARCNNKNCNISLWEVRIHLEPTRLDISKDYSISTFNDVRILHLKAELHFVAGWEL